MVIRQALLDVAVIEEIVPPSVGAPLHRHSKEDEVSYVVEGMFRFWRGDEVLDVGPGGIAFLPRHQVHTFKNIGTGPGRLLTVILPQASNASSRWLRSDASETRTWKRLRPSRLSLGWKYWGRHLPELRQA